MTSFDSLKGISPPDWLAVRLLYEVAIRQIYFFKQDAFIAAIVDVRTTRLIERTAWELMADGVSLEGFYVGRRDLQATTSGSHRASNFSAASNRREGSRLRLTDSRDGIETVEANDVWP
jgi:hypothetical protein